MSWMTMGQWMQKKRQFRNDKFFFFQGGGEKQAGSPQPYLMIRPLHLICRYLDRIIKQRQREREREKRREGKEKRGKGEERGRGGQNIFSETKSHFSLVSFLSLGWGGEGAAEAQDF